MYVYYVMKPTQRRFFITYCTYTVLFLNVSNVPEKIFKLLLKFQNNQSGFMKKSCYYNIRGFNIV